MHMRMTNIICYMEQWYKEQRYTPNIYFHSTFFA